MKTKQIILYSFRRCPYAMRVRMALMYAKIEHQQREILLKDKPQSLLDFSPKATVPVLVVDDKVTDESLQIMLWVLPHNDPGHFCWTGITSVLDRHKYISFPTNI